MELLYGGLPAWAFWTACGITLVAGFVKGAIGFAMPLIIMSGFSAIMPPEIALAGLILATLTTNIHQSLRDGFQAAKDSAWTFRRLIILTIIGILVSAPFVVHLPDRLLMGLLGIPIFAFAVLQLTGRSLAIKLEHQMRAEYVTGAVAGLYGGVSGIWGPPIVVYLLSIGANKADMIRVQGVIFLIGCAVLMFAHLHSGVLNAVTLPFSAALVVPAGLGMWAGFQMQDRLDPARFRFWTQIMLAVSALNLSIRAIFG